ncbi:MAG: hypothetical protein U1E08_05045 [Coriobacteriia bacterium]|nr:hypothetical protein [Coriobacteriia bacterium]
MADNRRTKMIVLIVAGVIVALLAGGAAGWFARGAKIAELEERIAELEEALADAESLESSETVEATDGVSESEGSGPEEPAEGDAPPSGGEGSTVTGPTERQPGIVVGVTTSGGTSVLRIDYVQFLTGGEAADAAAARGDESPPPNDYYVVNDNPRIREFPIQPGIPVKVVTNNDGTSDAMGHTITLAEWIAALSGPHAGAFKASLYWVTVTNGTVTAIEAQYVP